MNCVEIKFPTPSTVNSHRSAWIFSGTLIENVTLGAQKIDRQAFDRAVEACALRVDIDSLEHGERTLLGERGVNLSGGQKARVGLLGASTLRKYL